MATCGWIVASGSLEGQSEGTNLDANSLLSDLDKGLRSARSGEQCEAIVRFPWLFERYPFPILINSASLKLAELFRNGSNFARLLILKVIQESEKHLDKILNIDEFVRRLFAVTFSNDPVARAVTLRALGSIAAIVSERKNIHHCIRDSLDSHDELEASAAIEAAASFARKSLDFAVNICPKVLKMVSGLATPLEAKVNLLSVLHHSHYNSELALEVREQCVRFLPTYPSEKFVCSTLRTLSYIASTSLIQIPEQIDLLLNYFTEDPRINVKLCVLNELKLLALSAPHLWTKGNVEVLVECMQRLRSSGDQVTLNENLLSGVIAVLVELVKCACLLSGESEFHLDFNQMMVKFCLNVIYNQKTNINLTSVCFQLLTALSIYAVDEGPSILQQTVCALQAFILTSPAEADSKSVETYRHAYKSICRSVVMLCSSHDVDDQLVTALRTTLIDETLSILWLDMVCETLCAINYDKGDPQFLSNLLIVITKFSASREFEESTFTRLFTLYMQTLLYCNKSCPQTLVVHLEGKSHWCCFKVARQAMRFGHHWVASAITEKLRDLASSESVYFWMLSLSKVCRAESLLVKDGVGEKQSQKGLTLAVSCYVEAMTAMKAAVSPNNPLAFQCEYVRLRFKLLQAHALFRESCKLVRTSPAPAIAASTALATRDDLLKCGSVVTQMRKCAKEFRLLTDWYSLLYQSSFNADNQTLAHLQLLQNSCTIVAEAIESLFQTNRVSALFVNKDTHLENSRFGCSSQPCAEHKRLIEACHSISTMVRTQLSSKQSPGISNGSSIDCQHISLLLTISKELVSVPLCVPRLFFQSIQTTCIKLAVSPQPKSASDVILINSNSNFALKVEGVVVSGQNETLICRVAKVMLNVTSSLVSKASTSSDHFNKNLGNESGVNLHSIVVPHNDYFQTQFLLSLNVVGLHTVHVEASVIDESEAQWKTGPTSVSTSIKVVDDPNAK